MTLVLIRSKIILRTLGIKVAACYLNNRNVSIETAVYLLATVKTTGSI